jgi:deoxyribodipyrimidine photo-lyase
MKTIFWFRRDRRLQDNQALSFAASTSQELLPAFVLPVSSTGMSELRTSSVLASVLALDKSLPRGLQVLHGEASMELGKLSQEFSFRRVVATRAFDTNGVIEQEAVRHALAVIDVELVLVGSYYAVEPGTIVKDDQTAVRVYTPFFKRWLQVFVPEPFVLDVENAPWAAASQRVALTSGVNAGEDLALETWAKFRASRIFDYSDHRNRPDLNGTSKLSHALAHGEVHPRTLLAALGHTEGEEVFRKEIVWREFYADVMHHHPRTYDEYYEPRFADLAYDDPKEFPEKLAAWKAGATGYPIVDAAMRQLVQSGWMHNRARMIVASFLVKDLHFEWQIGAKFFEEHLTDFDPASNSHGWQWTAGCGTDASPFYRVFNPILQGPKFDPDGDYVRKWLPELAHLPAASVHEPWNDIAGYQFGYAPPILNHSQERDEALRRLEEIKR